MLIDDSNQKERWSVRLMRGANSALVEVDKRGVESIH